MDLDSLKTVRLRRTVGNRFYMPVEINYEQGIQEETFVQINNPKRIFTFNAEREFPAHFSSENLKIFYEEADHVLGTPLKDERVLNKMKIERKPLKIVRPYINLSRSIRDSLGLDLQILILEGQYDKGLSGEVEGDEENIKELMDDKHIIGYHLRTNDKLNISVQIPSLYTNINGVYQANTLLTVPMDLYAIKIIDKKFFEQ